MTSVSSLGLSREFGTSTWFGVGDPTTSTFMPSPPKNVKSPPVYYTLPWGPPSSNQQPRYRDPNTSIEVPLHAASQVSAGSSGSTTISTRPDLASNCGITRPEHYLLGHVHAVFWDSIQSGRTVHQTCPTATWGYPTSHYITSVLHILQLRLVWTPVSDKLDTSK